MQKKSFPNYILISYNTIITFILYNRDEPFQFSTFGGKLSSSFLSLLVSCLFIIIVEMFDFLKQGKITLEEVEKSIKELPLPEKVKAIAIYKRYREIKKIEEEMDKATREIEKKYLKLDEPVLTNVADIVNGKRAIQQQEVKEPEKYLTEDEIKEIPNQLAAHKIEGYWGKCLMNAPMVKESMGKDDEQLLKHIENIHVTDEEDSDNFTIHFTFGPNEVIKNGELKKRFVLKEAAPVLSEGTHIEWVSKNLTTKEIKKKQKNKKTGQQRLVTRQVQAKSFFNFFASHDATPASANPLEATEDELKIREELENDFQLGGVLVDEVLPYSLEYYLGVEHEGDQDFGDVDEDDEDNDDDEDEGDKKKKEKHHKSKSKSKSKGKDKKEHGKTEEKPECKNQ